MSDRIAGQPLVSIITVCLNSERHLERTIWSVLGQTYRKIEYIIVDGGSTDGTLDIIRKYENRISRWLSEPDQGLYDAMNKGVALAAGELVGIINSDDWYAPQAAKNVVSAYLNDPEAGVFFGDLELVDETGGYRQVVPGRPEDIGSLRWRVVHPATFVRRDLYRTRQYDLRFAVSADFDFLWKLHRAGVRFHYCPEVLASVSTGGKSYGCRTLIEEWRVRRKYCGSRLFLSNTAFLLTALGKKFVIRFILRNNYRHPALRFGRMILRRGAAEKK